jgi:hypothetical protein
MRLKVKAEATKIAESPKAAAVVCTREPVLIPSTERKPAWRPCAMLRPIIYIVSGPGMRLSVIPAMRKMMKS